MLPFGQQPADQRQPVVLVVDAELARKSEVLGLVAQQSRRKRMKGADPQPGRFVVEEACDALTHLPRRLVGEGDRKDPLRPDTVCRDEVRDARRQHPRLARPGPRHHQDRAGMVLDGDPLCRIESAERVGGAAHAATAAGNRIRKDVP